MANDEINKKLTLFGQLTANIYKKVGEGTLRFVSFYSEQIAPCIQKIQSTDYMKNFANGLLEFQKALEEARQNPNSLFNLVKYGEALESFHWCFPYAIRTEEIKEIIETVNSEKEFDEYMCRYFRGNKLKNLFNDTSLMLPRYQKTMYKQIEKSYWATDYAIANNALISIIDNHLAFYLANKGQGARVGIYEPIKDYFSEFSIKKVDWFLYSKVAMLNHVINTLFEDKGFDKPIVISTNKTFRRHPSNHGFQFSNKRVDTLLLLNTLYEILIVEKELSIFENSLAKTKKKDGKFYLIEKSKKKIDKIYQNLKNEE